MVPNTLEQVLAAITPERVRETIQALSARQSPQFRSLVMPGSVADALIGDTDLGQGQERGRAYEQVQLAIRDAVGQIPDMKYVHGST